MTKFIIGNCLNSLLLLNSALAEDNIIQMPVAVKELGIAF